MDNKKRQRPRGGIRRGQKRDRTETEPSTFPVATNQERSHKSRNLDSPPRTREEESHRFFIDYVRTTTKPLLPYRIPPIEDSLTGTPRQVIGALNYLAKKTGPKDSVFQVVLSEHRVSKASLAEALEQRGSENKLFKQLFEVLKSEVMKTDDGKMPSKFVRFCCSGLKDGSEAALTSALLDRDA